MTAVDLDALDAARAAIGDSPAFPVVGFEQDDEQVLACFDDGGTSVFAECYGTDAAALIVAAVNALPELVADARKLRALREAVESLAGRAEYRGVPVVSAADLRAALAAALTSEGERE